MSDVHKVRWSIFGRSPLMIIQCKYLIGPKVNTLSAQIKFMNTYLSCILLLFYSNAYLAMALIQYPGHSSTALPPLKSIRPPLKTPRGDNGICSSPTSGLKVYCFGVVESKIFQCKVENLKKSKEFWLPLSPLLGSGATARISSIFLKFQLCIERFLSVSFNGHTTQCHGLYSAYIRPI